MTRVESETSCGFPDVEGCLNGSHFNLELKSAIRPVRPSTPLRFHMRREQVMWLRRRTACGGRAFLLLRVHGPGGTAAYLLHGEHAEAIEAGLCEADLAALAIVPPASPPAEVLAAMAAWPIPAKLSR
jgi:hypothetical protein